MMKWISKNSKKFGKYLIFWANNFVVFILLIELKENRSLQLEVNVFKLNPIGILLIFLGF